MPITPSPAVLRAGDILNHLIEHPSDSFTVSELARIVEVPRATCDAILQALEIHQLVTRHEQDRSFELGPRSIALGEAARIANPTLRAAGMEAEGLARAIGSCVAVCIRDGETARVIEAHDSGPIFAMRTRVGQKTPLVPPFGAIFVAWDPADAEAWLAAPGLDLKDDEKLRYRRALEQIRDRGFSVTLAPRRQPETSRAIEVLFVPQHDRDDTPARQDAMLQMAHSDYLPEDLGAEERVRFAQISAPVFDREARVTLSLLMAGPDHDVSIAELHGLARRLVEAATNATRNTGGRSPI